jgi:hypothetical protein
MNAKHPLILALVRVVGAAASAQENLLPQGDFRNPGVKTGWAEGFNIPKNREFQVVSEDGKHWLRMENQDGNLYYHSDYRTDFPMGDNPYRYYRW